MDNFFDKATHFLGRNSENVFVINIGAMDGVMFDELIGYTTMYNFKGLYVEPIPYLFDRLRDNINNVSKQINIFENSAISDYDGEIEMLTIDREAIDSGVLHDCFYGMSAVYPPKNGLGSEFDRPTVEKYGKRVSVRCLKLQSLFNKHNITNFDILKIDAEGHDFKIIKQLDLIQFRPKIIRCEWINLGDEEKRELITKFDTFNYKYEILDSDITAITNEFHQILSNNFSTTTTTTTNSEINNQPTIITTPSVNYINSELPQNNKNLTIVTGLWDIGRQNLNNDWSRNYNFYLEKFNEILKMENNMIIFGDEHLQKFVMERRTSLNTQFILRNTDWFKNNEYYSLIQNVRVNPEWFNQVGWLGDSTQAKLELYNPLVMSKLFLLNDATIMDKFNSDYLFWLDAGISNTVHPGYFTHDKVLDKLPKHLKNFTFIAFPYEANTEIHGFKFDEINKYATSKVSLVGRGGFFGGSKDSISKINGIYYSLLIETLSNGLMGTEESLFSILLYKYPELTSYFEIQDNGLITTFFENLKNDNVLLKTIDNPNSSLSINEYSEINYDTNHTNIGLYVIGFNSPNQFETLITSMLEYDKNFIEKPRKILLDNSTDLTTTPVYSELCSKYGFEHIKKDNLGICGGRQWIAEHFDKSDLEYMFFFEDDMFFYPKNGEVCRNGFNRMVDNLYDKSISISKKENFDFLKLNFSEFFGDNSTQWAWYNVPQMVRDEFWPQYSRLPEQGTDPNAPKVKYENIKVHHDVPYVTGEIYYCNWPQIVSKSGSRKMFLETTWVHPYEQTWMSFMYQELKKGNLKFGLLLLTPTEHNRFDHYNRELRKES